jgi:hypothetical protein
MDSGKLESLTGRWAKKNRAVARFFGFCLTLVKHSVVERMGIEPTTSTMRTWRSPS